MATVSLALFKKHCNADEYSTDDTYLQHLLDAAEAAVVRATNRTSEELIALGDGTTMPLQLQQATMMLGAHWFNQRESVSAAEMHEVPDSLSALIKQFRKLGRTSSTSSSSSDE